MLFSLFFACVPELVSPEDSSASSCWMEVDNQWSSATPRNLTAEGFGIGQTPPDMCMLDQHGDMVSLWQFYGQVVVVDISAEWCAPCKELAEGVDETWLEYKDQDVMYLTILTEDNFSETPGQDVLASWAEEHEITAPVLSDTEKYKQQLVPTGAYPRVMIIDRSMKVQIDTLNPVTEDKIKEAIENAL